MDYPGSPGKGAAKRVCVCVCVCYKQERGCLMHFACLAKRLLKYEESARDNHVVACNFAKY